MTPAADPPKPSGGGDVTSDGPGWVQMRGKAEQLVDGNEHMNLAS